MAIYAFRAILSNYIYLFKSNTMQHVFLIYNSQINSAVGVGEEWPAYRCFREYESLGTQVQK